MNNGYSAFEWAPNDPISDDLNGDFDSDYPIVNVLNKTDTFEETNEDNNNVNDNGLEDEKIVKEMNEYIINDEESVDEIIYGNIISDDESYVEENDEFLEENKILKKKKKN